ncbi:hypothetical protein FSP39_005565 [Pinctada imbricata]|uniref:RING-type E3 ubiquitin transferase n=1 Tax=Pinctada imbricata TaxID=66713 RepID=A0AA88XLB7_PINIB|nr:hypothetical protein FSP39_005565 [Pinctada imbricata]
MNSETFRYKRGTNQLFSQSTHILDPWKYPEEDWQFDPGKETVPIVISCVVEDEEHPVHNHITYAIIERSSADGGYIIKPLKQKQFVDGTLYLLQEIYGIENKQVDRSKLDPDDDVEDSGAECVICMSDMRDTLILPCRHLCLCATCAESLRYQASSCPICRSPFRALLQIRAMRKKQQLPVHTGENNEENTVSQEGVPQGYEAVSLIEAVNGPCSQMFTVDGGLQFPVRIPPDVDSHREKKRSSKRHLINVKPEETVNTNVTLKPDDKKVLDEEEEERKKSTPHDPLEVVRMEQIEQNKEEMGSVGHFNKKDSTDDSTSSKIVNVSGEYSSDNTDVKDLSDQHMSVELKVYESEAESDYELKPVSLMHDQQTSTENLADDEREDTSEGEGEPEPDYDDDEDDENVRKEDEMPGARVRVSNKRDSTLSETPPTRHSKGIVYVKDCSRSTGTLNVEGYQNLHIASSTSLPENTTSGTEGSSCGSSQGLLPDSHLTDDDK